MISIISCKKPEPILPSYNAAVLSFEGRKAYCLYGWMIKIGNDTILSTNDFLREEVGYFIDEPVKINIEVISKEDFCKYPYCEVVKNMSYYSY